MYFKYRAITVLCLHFGDADAQLLCVGDALSEAVGHEARLIQVAIDSHFHDGDVSLGRWAVVVDLHANLGDDKQMDRGNN